MSYEINCLLSLCVVNQPANTLAVCVNTYSTRLTPEKLESVFAMGTSVHKYLRDFAFYTKTVSNNSIGGARENIGAILSSFHALEQNYR